MPEINRVVFNLTRSRPGLPDSYQAIPTTVTQESVKILEEIDHIGRSIIEKHNFHTKISQTIFVLFGADPYGIGKRSVALRAVITDDFMTVTPVIPLHPEEMIGCARTGKPVTMTWECLDEMESELINQCNIGAFVLDITDKPPATTCWE